MNSNASFAGASFAGLHPAQAWRWVTVLVVNMLVVLATSLAPVHAAHLIAEPVCAAQIQVALAHSVLMSRGLSTNPAPSVSARSISHAQHAKPLAAMACCGGPSCYLPAPPPSARSVLVDIAAIAAHFPPYPHGPLAGYFTLLDPPPRSS